jgi:glucokinase
MPEATSSVLCVDIGGTSTKASLLDGSGKISSVHSIPTGPNIEIFADALCGLIELTAAAGDVGNRPCGIGIAVAGFLDSDRTCLIYNPNIPWLQSFPLKSRIAQRFGLPVELEVDSNAACMAEYRFGAYERTDRFLCLTAGTGLGVGMTVSGEPLRFAYGCMGDAGHVIVGANEPLCTCGGRGCAEAIIAAPALTDRYRAASGDESCESLSDVIEAARRGEPGAIAILRDAGYALGIAIASLANIFFPDHVAIAGGLSAAGPFVLEPAEQTFRKMASTLASSGVKVSQALLGPNATLIGAAWPFWKELSLGESKS